MGLRLNSDTLPGDATWAAPHYVYYCLDSTGELLYVGCSVNVEQRMKAHTVTSAWRPYVARLSIHPVGMPRAEARQFEEAEIRRLTPVFNRWPREANLFKAQRYLEERGAGDRFIHPSSRVTPWGPLPGLREISPYRPEKCIDTMTLYQLSITLRQRHRERCLRLIQEAWRSRASQAA